MTRELEIECLPGAIPQEIVVDVAGLHIGDHVEAKDLQLPGDVTYIGAPEAVIAAVSHARVEVVETTEVAAADEAAEPEVIKRGKEEEEGEGED